MFTQHVTPVQSSIPIQGRSKFRAQHPSNTPYPSKTSYSSSTSLARTTSAGTSVPRLIDSDYSGLSPGEWEDEAIRWVGHGADQIDMLRKCVHDSGFSIYSLKKESERLAHWFYHELRRSFVDIMWEFSFTCSEDNTNLVSRGGPHQFTRNRSISDDLHITIRNDSTTYHIYYERLSDGRLWVNDVTYIDRGSKRSLLR
jgi:hypothetical protein